MIWAGGEVRVGYTCEERRAVLGAFIRSQGRLGGAWMTYSIPGYPSHLRPAPSDGHLLIGGPKRVSPWARFASKRVTTPPGKKASAQLPTCRVSKRSDPLGISGAIWPRQLPPESSQALGTYREERQLACGGTIQWVETTVLTSALLLRRQDFWLCLGLQHAYHGIGRWAYRRARCD